MNRFLLVALVILAGMAANAQAPQRPANPASASSVEAGKKLFVSIGCYQCHGHEAQGSSATGPRLGPRAIPLGA